MTNYTSVQDDIRGVHGITRTGAQLIAAWKGFIDECADGYSWDISEYLNELRVRTDIETLLSSECLRSYPDHEEFARAVEALDERFKTLSHPKWRFPGRSTWWESLVPARAGRDFATYCSQVYGFQVEIV